MILEIMTNQVTKEQATEALRVLTADHANEEYFLKAETVSHDIGFGVDMRVDGPKWRASKRSAPSRINKVPICVLMVG